MTSLPTGSDFRISYVNDSFYRAHNKTFNFGSPEIRCLTNAVAGQDGSNNPPRSGFPLTGDVRLSDMQGKPKPADGTLSYTIPGNYTLPIPVHTYIKVEVNGAGGGGGGWGQEDHGIVMGTDVDIHIYPGGNGNAGQQSKFSCTTYYGDLVAYPGTGGPGANPRSGPTITAINGGGYSTDSTATIYTGGAGNRGLCTAEPTLFWNDPNFYSPLTNSRYCFNETQQFRLVCAWSSVGAICHGNWFYGGGGGGSGGRVVKIWQHDVTNYFLPWADAGGVVNATLTVGAGGTQGTRGYIDTGDFDALGQGQPGSIIVTFSTTEPTILPPEPPPGPGALPTETTIQGRVICGYYNVPGLGYITGYAANTYSNVNGNPVLITIGSVNIAISDSFVDTSTFTVDGTSYLLRAMLTSPDIGTVSVRVSKQNGNNISYPVALQQMSLSLFYVDSSNEHHTYSSNFVNHSEYLAPAPNIEYSYVFAFNLGFSMPSTGTVQFIFTVK